MCGTYVRQIMQPMKNESTIHPINQLNCRSRLGLFSIKIKFHKQSGRREYEETRRQDVVDLYSLSFYRSSCFKAKPIEQSFHSNDLVQHNSKSVSNTNQDNLTQQLKIKDVVI